MVGIIFLILRFLLALVLYIFLGWALLTLWRDLKHAGEITTRQSPSIELQVINADQVDSQQFNLSTITIGRDPGCDFVLPSEKVSANHARLSFHHNQWWAEDLDSTNGSYLNETAIIVPTVVVDGDYLRCGDVTLTVRLSV